jgi:hypothetical protein
MSKHRGHEQRASRLGLLSIAWMLIANDGGNARTSTPKEAKRKKEARDKLAAERKASVEAMNKERERQKEPDYHRDELGGPSA